MQDDRINRYPAALDAIAKATKSLGFDMASEPMTGALLASLAASKPGGHFLELGTGSGLSAAWILFGMDGASTLLSLDNDAEVQAVARRYLGEDPRVEFICTDAGEWLKSQTQASFDFIFADAWPGKFSHLELALNLLTPGGIYLIDDLLPQANWPEGHAPRVPELMQRIENLPGFSCVRMAWASGLMLVVKQSPGASSGR